VEKTRGAGRKRKKHAEGGMLVGRGLRSGKAMLQCYLLFPSFSSPYPLCSTSTIRNPWACEHVPDLQQQRSSPEWTVFVGLSTNVSRRKWSQFHNFARRNFESANAETTPRVRKKKCRLDELCMEQYPHYSRTMIQSFILQGKVMVDGKPAAKAGTSVKSSAIIDITAAVPKYVCRAGYKLEAALEQFACDVEGKVALDAGLSTGGFSDCLLQNGVKHIYGVDVGYGQVAEKIRTDPRVSVIERTNLRYLPCLPQLVDLVTLDLSFISILLVMPAVCGVMKSNSTLITLIKPQFEAHRFQVGRGGIVRDVAVHKEVLHKVITGVEAFGFACQAWIQSPITGAEGNIEFLACFHRSQVKDTTTMNLSVESEKLLCIEELGVDKDEEQ